MASAEYYLGTEGAQQYHQSQQNLHAPPQQALSQYQHPAQQYPQSQFSAPLYNQSPQSYSPYPPHQQQHAQGYFAQQQHPANHYPAASAPYPTTPPPPQQQHQQHQQPNTYLSAPLQPIRSHSQPARVRFADQDSDSTDLGSASDSASPPRRRHRRHRSHARDRSRDRSRDRALDSDYDSDSRSRHHSRSHSRHHHSQRKHERSQRDRDTFLGAGAGGLIGDVIFPGLGTAAGLLMGGLGGRKYAERSRSDDGHRHRSDGRRRAGEQGWDEESRTFKSGTAVR